MDGQTFRERAAATIAKQAITNAKQIADDIERFHADATRAADRGDVTFTCYMYKNCKPHVIKHAVNSGFKVDGDRLATGFDDVVAVTFS